MRGADGQHVSREGESGALPRNKNNSEQTRTRTPHEHSFLEKYNFKVEFE